MPMSFPTHQSVVNRATQRGFRAPVDGETEDQYRSNFADFMRLVDPVEASEISSGRGWDQQSPLGVLLGSGLFDKNRSEFFMAEIQVLDLASVPSEVARGIRVEINEDSARLVCDYYHGRAQEYRYSDHYLDEDDLQRVELVTKTINIVVKPQDCKYPLGLLFEDRESHFLAGNYICLLDVECSVIDELVSEDFELHIIDAITKKRAVTTHAKKRQQFICLGLPKFMFKSHYQE